MFPLIFFCANFRKSDDFWDYCLRKCQYLFKNYVFVVWKDFASKEHLYHFLHIHCLLKQLIRWYLRTSMVKFFSAGCAMISRICAALCYKPATKWRWANKFCQTSYNHSAKYAEKPSDTPIPCSWQVHRISTLAHGSWFYVFWSDKVAAPYRRSLQNKNNQ